MKFVVYDEPGKMIAWAEDRLLGIRFRDDARAIGVKSENGYHGVVVFDTFTGTTCSLSVASDGSKKWLSREFIIKCMAYPFLQLKLPRLTSFVSSSNHASLQFCKAFGFQEEGRMREAGLFGEDVIMFGMLKAECHWLNMRLSSQTTRETV